MIDGFRLGIGEEEAQQRDVAEDRHPPDDPVLLGLLETADRQMLAAVQVDRGRSLAADQGRNLEARELKRGAEIELTQLGRDLERDAPVFLDGGSEVQQRAELL